MKIQFLMTQDIESPGGVGRYLPLAKALSQLGHSIVISALHHDYQMASKGPFFLEGVKIQNLGQMHVLKRGDGKTYFNSLELIRIASIGTYKLIRAGVKENPDVLLVCKTQPMNGLAAWVIHKLKGIPVYLDCDDFETLNNRFAHRWQQKIVQWFENWMPSFACGITVTTKKLAKHYESLGYPKNQIHIIPHGFDLKLFASISSPNSTSVQRTLRQKYGIHEKDRVIVYVGSMSLVNHAIDLLLEAFASIIHDFSNLFLLLVGGGEDFDELQQYAIDLGLGKYVKFTGRVQSDLIPHHYRLGDISTNPLRNTETAQYSLSLKLVETVAAEVPCISADIGDAKDIIGNAGITVAPGDMKAFADGLRQAFQDPNKLKSMQLEAKQLRKLYSWNQRVKEYIQVFQNQPDEISN